MICNLIFQVTRTSAMNVLTLLFRRVNSTLEWTTLVIAWTAADSKALKCNGGVDCETRKTGLMENINKLNMEIRP